MATGEPLLPGDSSLDQLARIMRATGPLNPHMATCLSRDLRTPLTSLLANHAAQKGPNGLLRQTLGARLSPALLDLIEACLRPDPKDRPTAEQLLRLPYFLDAPRLFAGSALEVHYAKDPVFAAMRSPAAALQQATEAAAAAAAAVVSGAEGSAGCLAQRPAADTTDAGRAACKAMDAAAAGCNGSGQAAVAAAPPAAATPAAAATTAAASMAHHRRYDYAPPQQERAAERHHRHLAARAHAGRADNRSMAASSGDTSDSGVSGGSGGSVNATAPPAHTTSGLSSITMSSSSADCAPPSAMMMRTRTSCSGMTTTTTQGNSGRDTSTAPSCSLDGNTATSAVVAAAAAAVVAATAAGCGGGSCTVGADAAAAEACGRTALAQGADAARRSMGLHKRQASSVNDAVMDETGSAPLQPKLSEATATEVPAEEVWRGDANKSRRLASTILPPDKEMTTRTSSLVQDAVAAAAMAAAVATATTVVQPAPEGKSGATDYHACHSHEVSTRAAAAASAFATAAGRAVAAAAGTAGAAAAAVNSVNVVVSPVVAAEGTGSNNSSAPLGSHTPGPTAQTDAHAGYVASPSRLCKHGYDATESPFVSAAAPLLDTGLRGLPASTTCTEEQQPTAASASGPLFITLPATFVAAAAPLAGGVPAAGNPDAQVRSHGDPAAAATELAAASAASLQTAAGVPAAAAMAAAAMAARSRSMYGSSGPRDGAAAAAAHASRTSTAPNAASGPSGMVLWSHGWSERIDTGSSYGTVCGPAAGPALPAVHRETSYGCYGVGVGASGSAFAVMAAAAALPSGASHGNGHGNSIYNGILTSVANIPTIFQAQVGLSYGSGRDCVLFCGVVPPCVAPGCVSGPPGHVAKCRT